MKLTEYDGLSESLRKSLEISQKLADQVSPIIERQNELQRIADSFKGTLPDISANIPALDALASIGDTMRVLTENSTIKALGEIAIAAQIPNYTFRNPMLEQISTGMTSVVQAFGQSIANVLAESTVDLKGTIGNAFVNAMKSPVIEWLQGIDLMPMYTALEGLRLDDDILKRYKEFNQAYLAAMFECKWFPYAGWAADISLTEEVSDILATSRGASKRREKRIDKAILAYYTPKEIKAIKRSWRNSDLDPHIKRILGQALEAHLLGEYALCISSLSTLWEGLIYIKANNAAMKDRHRQRMEVTKKELAELTESNDYDKIFSDYFDQWIVSQCNEVGDVVDGVPNRHGVSHSWYRNYPNKKASLNAVLLTDFIIHLEPLERDNVE